MVCMREARLYVRDCAGCQVNGEAKEVGVFDSFELNGVAEKVLVNECLDGWMWEKVFVVGDEPVVHVAAVVEMEVRVVGLDITHLDSVRELPQTGLPLSACFMANTLGRSSIELLPSVPNESVTVGSQPIPAPRICRCGCRPGRMQASRAKATMVGMSTTWSVRWVGCRRWCLPMWAWW